MNNSIIKLLADSAEQENKMFVLIAVVVFILFAILLFIYLASCIIIVKQGTRKIVERFGSYNRTLKEGIHIIFRPFDKIDPVPWNILSISERDEFDKNMSRRRIPFFNDGSSAEISRLERDRVLLRKKLEKDIRLLIREKYIDQSENVSAAYADSLDIDGIVLNSTGKRLASIIDSIIVAEDKLIALEQSYREIGIDPYRADKSLVDMLASRERMALAASVKY